MNEKGCLDQESTPEGRSPATMDEADKSTRPGLVPQSLTGTGKVQPQQSEDSWKAWKVLTPGGQSYVLEQRAAGAVGESP